MKKNSHSLMFIVILLLTVGCAGTRFARLSDEQIVLGHDTSRSIQQKLGEPYQEATVIKNGKSFNVITYHYAKVSSWFFAGGATFTREQSFYFHDDILVGHVYTSSWDEDTTDFDESKIGKIKKGETKIEEVLALLGTPSGECIYPLTEKEDEKAKVYSYFRVHGGLLLRIYEEMLTISYDTNGVVTKIDHIATSRK